MLRAWCPFHRFPEGVGGNAGASRAFERIGKETSLPELSCEFVPFCG